ncbi:hypothetical protein D9M69_530140 [compost metagenome]
MANGDEQQRTGAPDLLLDMGDGAHAGDPAADTQRLVEFEAPARGHAVAVVRWRQEAAARRMAVRAQAGFAHRVRLLEERPVPQRRQGVADDEVGFVERGGDALDHGGVELLVGLFAAPDPGADGGIAHGVVFRHVLVFRQECCRRGVL